MNNESVLFGTFYTFICESTVEESKMQSSIHHFLFETDHQGH